MKQFLLGWVICISFIAGFLFAPSAAAETRQEWVGKVVSVQGSVQLRKAGRTEWVPVHLNDTCYHGDIIRVQARSRAAVLLRNDRLLRLDQKTAILFPEQKKEPDGWLNLLNGALHFFSQTPQRLKIITPFVNAAVGGTEFFIRVEHDQTFVSVFEGRVAATNKAGSLLLTSGQSAVARSARAPEPRVVVRPRDAVQWALYYPPILDDQPSDFPGGAGTGWQARTRASIRRYWQGDLTRALSSLPSATGDIRDPGFFTYRAGLLLSVGRVDEARSDIDKALKLDPQHSRAVALQAVIAVVQNEKDKALDLAQKAVALGPKSATARLALSYAEQAHFRIEKALKSLLEALELNPENALAWARLAELYLSVGNLDQAIIAAKKGVVLNPQLARTQTVLGFAHIHRIEIQDATSTFNHAIQLDSAAPLPRLGLGLAMIRNGDLEAGRVEIEIAAGLDPNNSLIRSYLGKAYYDERRNRLARDQYEIAKQLDPKDPTPWFYDAIREQTANRPVVALHRLRKAIELNDNRGVYRSRLLLDQDLAARSAALGRIYNDLGFQQIGLLAGWKSLNSDPSNYSAHRLLADSYSLLPRQEITRVSELLQSQLLQPLNITPVQPQLSQTNLLILEGAGPSQPSFNEFNPLFLRNRFALQGSGVVGNHETIGDELTQSGVWGRYSYSLGQFYYDTDGFRDNNELNDKIYTAYAQVSLSPKASVQAEYRHRDLEHGDLAFDFNLDDFDDAFDRDVRTDVFRVGLRYAPAEHSDILASVIYQDRRERESTVFAPFAFDARGNSDGYIAEGQYLFRQPLFSIIAGGGHYDADNALNITRKINNINTPIVREDFDTKHSNAYLYSNLHYPSMATWTIGASYDNYDDGINGDTQRLNPKLGLTLDLTTDTTLRFAYFNVLKRTLFADQTLEPTQVAGFSQFFDDFNGTKITNYGAAVDHAFSANLSAGLEYFIRRLRVPLGLDTIVRESWDEDLVRAYLYWTPLRDFSLSLEYQYEDFDRNARVGADTPTDVNTHLLPATLGYFHSSGLFGRLRTTYVNQDAKLADTVDDDDQFVLVDLAVGYRFPKRYGILSLGVANIFDNDFHFQGIESRTSRENASQPPFSPERTVAFKLTLSF